MEIQIDNFKNIQKLNIELDDSKLNFIYGISGSGKSSISKALIVSSDEIQSYKTFGSDNDAIVNIIGKKDFKVFDDEAVKEYIITKSGKGVYDVFFGENDKLRKLKEGLQEFLTSSDVIDIRNVIQKHRESLSNLNLELGLSKTPSGSLSKKGVYKVLSDSQDYTVVHDELSVKQKSWMKEGRDFLVDNKCPFCFQNMTQDIMNKIMEIIHELPDECQTIIKANEKLKQLGINIDLNNIYNKQVQDDLKKVIDKEYKIEKELSAIEEVFNISLNNDKSLEKKTKIKLSTETIEFFRNMGVDIQSFLDRLEKEKEGYLTKKKEYNGVLRSKIKGNISKINEYIAEFGIKYRFNKDDVLSPSIGYNLVHVDANGDTSEFLSTGEKSIISLILFLIANKNEDLVIDDPVSSYDEYRREKILKFIIRYRHFNESNNAHTTLILSHDQIFLKFLTRLLEDDNYCNVIGKTYHLENYNRNCLVSRVVSDDIDTLLNHIKNRCQEVEDYGLKIINLRLLYELTNANGIEYSYLSAILHSNKNVLSEEELALELKQKNKTEDEIINMIWEKTSVKLPKYRKGSFQINKKTSSKFELLCYVREFVQGEDKKELNNIVHFNYALFHILNPYKFNFQSEKSYEILDKWLEEN